MLMRQIEKSSNVVAVGYDPGTQTYAVHFKAKDGTPAPHVHHYAGVDAELAQQVDASESTGTAVRRFLVNGGFEFSKVEAASSADSGGTGA